MKMKREYDLSKVVRGKFYRKGAEIRLPIYLDAKLQQKIEQLARKKGRGVNELVSQLLKKEMAALAKSA